MSALLLYFCSESLPCFSSPSGSDLLEAAGTQQAIARDLLEVAHGADTAQIKRRDRRRLVGSQQRLVHHVFKDARQRQRREAGANRCGTVAEHARNIVAFQSGAFSDEFSQADVPKRIGSVERPLAISLEQLRFVESYRQTSKLLRELRVRYIGWLAC